VIKSVSQKLAKVSPCICGSGAKGTLYKSSDMSPDKGDVILGTIIFLALEFVLPVVFFFSGITVLTPVVVLPVPVIMLALAIYRLLHGHAIGCSLRWAYMAVVGAAKFLIV
jgi:hypothetical protein